MGGEYVLPGLIILIQVFRVSSFAIVSRQLVPTGQANARKWVRHGLYGFP
ncbi:hypothetical protein SynROS8604_03238 [Synechococcus sp. ROS8604]|nr:hypothetical protein SynROS8604_00996 [Synechococcus sp. ROS8604]QNI89849.1 hypothetical protein SynROS8604_03238 [Synechococcus sp. ROS8604]